ncbi:hypothetical protein F4780DRAFT_218605 [Xylariomycetidae sp. FL0641]|nr:hypothetical protein F4780DRAFT_218605 [Xylariomycetidae sp. FL0641]
MCSCIVCGAPTLLVGSLAAFVSARFEVSSLTGREESMLERQRYRAYLTVPRWEIYLPSGHIRLDTRGSQESSLQRSGSWANTWPESCNQGPTSRAIMTPFVRLCQSLAMSTVRCRSAESTLPGHRISDWELSQITVYPTGYLASCFQIAIPTHEKSAEVSTLIIEQRVRTQLNRSPSLSVLGDAGFEDNGTCFSF